MQSGRKNSRYGIFACLDYASDIYYSDHLVHRENSSGGGQQRTIDGIDRDVLDVQGQQVLATPSGGGGEGVHTVRAEIGNASSTLPPPSSPTCQIAADYQSTRRGTNGATSGAGVRRRKVAGAPERPDVT